MVTRNRISFHASSKTLSHELGGALQVTIATDSGGITGAAGTELISYDRYGFSPGGRPLQIQRRSQLRPAEAGATQTRRIVRLAYVVIVFSDDGGYFSGVG
jgi:hypothetical protein